MGTQGDILDAGAKAEWALLALVGRRWGQVGALVSPRLVSPQIHWPASQQRIEECILSGKNSNVSGHLNPLLVVVAGLAASAGVRYVSSCSTLEKSGPL